MIKQPWVKASPRPPEEGGHAKKVPVQLTSGKQREGLMGSGWNCRPWRLWSPKPRVTPNGGHHSSLKENEEGKAVLASPESLGPWTLSTPTLR